MNKKQKRLEKLYLLLEAEKIVGADCTSTVREIINISRHISFPEGRYFFNTENVYNVKDYGVKDDDPEIKD